MKSEKIMQQLEQLTQQALDAIEQATNVNELESIRVNYFGKKGHFTGLMQGLRDLTPEEGQQRGKKLIQRSRPHKVH